MSEFINNREYRQKVLKELIMELHKGKSIDEVKSRFQKLIEGVSPAEISEMEQSLIMEGMPVQEVQRLCDVHAAVFKGSIEQVHHPEETEGHPVHTFKLENRELERLINDKINIHIQEFSQNDSQENIHKLLEDFNLLWDIDKHYSRKENLLFPYMEKYGITAPPKVMWGVDDEVRDGIKTTKELLKNYKGNKEQVIEQAKSTVTKVSEMVFKEENILFPMVMPILTPNEWASIADESDSIGYCLTSPNAKYKAAESQNGAGLPIQEVTGTVKFETGILTNKEINGILNYLPFDITFIDKDDVVKYFTNSKDRIFARTKAIIGRNVQNCHPPASVHIVEKMLDDFKSGAKTHEDFWISMGDLYAYIRYFAVHDEKGEYMGTIEVTQNIRPIQEIKGEKRLLS